MSDYNFITDTNITVTTYRNSAKGYSYGVDLFVSSSALKWWNINSTLSVYDT